MTQTPPRVTAQDLAELQNSAKAQLVRAIAALNQLTAKVDAGTVGPKSEANKTLGDIRDWLKIAHEMELRLEKYELERGGRECGHGTALDLAEARTTIGGRLDRLWTCRGFVPPQVLV